MTVSELHALTGKLIAQKRGDAEIGVALETFRENEEGKTIDLVAQAKFQRVQGADDSGPVGPKFPFLVLSGSYRD